MVAKLITIKFNIILCLNLAKIHMVAKHSKTVNNTFNRLNLAKIHMVAKPR